MVISCGNLPSELYHPRPPSPRRGGELCPHAPWVPNTSIGRERTAARRPRGEEAVGRRGADGRVGLDGGDITKMSENVTHLIIYAPRSRRSCLGSLFLSLSLFPTLPPFLRSLHLSLSVPLAHQSSFQRALPLLRQLSTSPPRGTSSPAARSLVANPPAATSSSSSSTPHSREKLIWPY